VEAVQIEISDTGKGLSPEDQKHLFQPFFTRSSKGTGMGLVIAKKIIDDHHGSICIKSETDVGTIVLVDLPVGNSNSGSTS
jgi:signal transduction histidine kinase